MTTNDLVTRNAEKLMKLKTFVKEMSHLTRGAFGMDFGWGNGYVCVPEGHPAYGMSYDDVHDNFDISVNGGLTFAEHAKDLEWTEIPEDCKDCWVLGFDTAHSGDTLSLWPKSAVELEAQKLAEQLTK